MRNANELKIKEYTKKLEEEFQKVMNDDNLTKEETILLFKYYYENKGYIDESVEYMENPTLFEIAIKLFLKKI